MSVQEGALFTAVDPRGFSVICTRERFERHILEESEHDELRTEGRRGASVAREVNPARFALSSLRLPDATPTVDGEFWLRADPETGEVCGVEIEDFEAVYLKKHPELAVIWSEAEGHERPQLPAEVRIPFVERILRQLRALDRAKAGPPRGA